MHNAITFVTIVLVWHSAITYIVHKMTTIMNPGRCMFVRTTKYDPKCKRNINVYMSTKKWQIGKSRRALFTDYV